MDFPVFALNRRLLYLRRDLTSKASLIFAALERLGEPGLAGEGNRQSGFRINLDGEPDLFVRCMRRGGLVRHLFKDVYFGLNPRPVRELAVTAEARHRGIAVAEPIGAMVEWVSRLAYRGAFLTRAIAGMTLWDFVRADDDNYVRVYVLEEARRAVDAMHRLGLCHADLNLHNILVTKSGESFAAAILDLDKAMLFSSAVPLRLRRQNLARLERSARKLDPKGRFLDAEALAVLTGI